SSAMASLYDPRTSMTGLLNDTLPWTSLSYSTCSIRSRQSAGPSTASSASLVSWITSARVHAVAIILPLPRSSPLPASVNSMLMAGDGPRRLRASSLRSVIVWGHPHGSPLSSGSSEYIPSHSWMGPPGPQRISLSSMASLPAMTTSMASVSLSTCQFWSLVGSNSSAEPPYSSARPAAVSGLSVTNRHLDSETGFLFLCMP